MKVNNLTNNDGRAIPNQFLIEDQEKRWFQSYSSIIILWEKGKIYLDINKWDYSMTTGKYRNQLLYEKKSETEKKIKNGIYILKDLNEK